MTDPITFDLGLVLAGRSYPRTEVPVYLDEEAGFQIYRADQELQRLANLKKVEEYNALEEKFQALLKQVNDQRYVFHLKGTPRKIRQDIFKKVRADHPEVIDSFGRVVPNPEADEQYALLTWAAHIEKIVAPDGKAMVAPSVENLQQFRELAPDTAIQAVENALSELQTGTKSGFEAAVRESDFLSEASPEG